MLFNLLAILFFPDVGRVSLRDIGSSEGRRVPGWSLNLVILNIALVYLSAAIAKIQNAGMAWAEGGTLQTYLYERYLMTGNTIAKWVADRFWLCRIFSVASAAIEAFFWLALPIRRIRPAVGLIGIAMHVAIYFVMTINFKIFAASYLVFVPYERILAKLPRAAS